MNGASAQQPHPAPASLDRQDWATICIALTLATLPAVMPVMVGALARTFHLDIEQAGFVVSANMGGILAGSLLGNALARRWSDSWLLSVGIIVMIAGNLLTMVQTGFAGLIVMRALSGGGEGVAIAAAYALMAQSRHPERVIGFYTAGQGMIGVVGMAGLTLLVAQYGAGAFYLAVSAVALLGLALIPTATRGRTSTTAASAEKGRVSRQAYAALVAVFLFFCGLALVWAFLERIASAHGFGVASVATALSASAAAGIAGSLSVALFAHRLASRQAMILGALLLILCGAGLTATNDLAFGGAVCLLSFTWNFQFSFLFRCVAAAEGGVRAGGFVPVATSGALTVGPAIGGVILNRGGIAVLDIAFVITTLSALALAAAVSARTGNSAAQLLPDGV